MKQISDRYASAPTRVLISVLVALLAVMGLLKVGSVLAADPTPQGSFSFSNATILAYNGITRTAEGLGLGVITSGYGMGDCYNNVAYQSGLVNTATVKIQSSSDGSNWVDTQSFVDITNTVEMSRIVMYGGFTRALVSAVFTTANPMTGTVICTLRNNK